MNIFNRKATAIDDYKALQIVANYDAVRTIEGRRDMEVEPESIATLRAELRKRGLLSDGKEGT